MPPLTQHSETEKMFLFELTFVSWFFLSANEDDDDDENEESDDGSGDDGHDDDDIGTADCLQ